MYRKDIAAQVGVTEKTLRNWIDKGDWDAMKDAETITRSKLLQDSYKQLAAINNKINVDFGGIPDKQLSDAKGVIRKEIEALSEMPLHKYIEVVTDLLDWVKTNQPEKVMDAVDITDGFVQHLFADRG